MERACRARPFRRRRGRSTVPLRSCLAWPELASFKGPPAATSALLLLAGLAPRRPASAALSRAFSMVARATSPTLPTRLSSPEAVRPVSSAFSLAVR